MHLLHACRFGSGYTLQAKINPDGISTPDTPSVSPLLPIETSTSVANSSKDKLASHGPSVAAAVRGGGDGAVVDTSALKSFIEESFQGAMLMEEHQVCFYRL